MPRWSPRGNLQLSALVVRSPHDGRANHRTHSRRDRRTRAQHGTPAKSRQAGLPTRRVRGGKASNERLSQLVVAIFPEDVTEETNRLGSWLVPIEKELKHLERIERAIVQQLEKLKKA